MTATVRRRTLAGVLIFVLIAMMLAFVLFPLVWVLSTALKNKAETFSTPPYLIPKAPTLDSFISIWEHTNLELYFLNSFVVAISTTVICLIVANLAAFGFSRFRMKYGDALIMLILISQMVPSVLFVIPYFNMMSELGLINTKIAVIIAHTSFSLPFCTWLLRGYYESIPLALDEAARLDGCSRLKVLTRIVFPLSMPGNVATMIFAFMLSWNEYLFSLSLTIKETMYTVPVGISMFMGEYQTEWNELMAASLAASIPVIILYVFVDRYMVGGLTAGSVRH